MFWQAIDLCYIYIDHIEMQGKKLGASKHRSILFASLLSTYNQKYVLTGLCINLCAIYFDHVEMQGSKLGVQTI
jgi:hypothetical protein